MPRICGHSSKRSVGTTGSASEPVGLSIDFAFGCCCLARGWRGSPPNPRGPEGDRGSGMAARLA
jgi:hypothetical protein